MCFSSLLSRMFRTHDPSLCWPRNFSTFPHPDRKRKKKKSSKKRRKKKATPASPPSYILLPRNNYRSENCETSGDWLARPREAMHLWVEKEDTCRDRTERLEKPRINLLRSKQADPWGNRNRMGNAGTVAAGQRAARLRICIADEAGSCR